MSPAALLICTSALHRIAQRLPGYSPDLSPPELARLIRQHYPRSSLPDFG